MLHEQALHSGTRRKVTAHLLLLMTTAMAAEWIVVVAGVKPHEMLAVALAHIGVSLRNIATVARGSFS